MNAVTPFAKEVDTGAWDRATDRVNAWRGEVLHRFAQAEWAVSETLVIMRAVGGAGEKVRLRRLTGQRFEDLRIAVGPGGPFAAEGEKAFAALAEFAQHEPLRPFLCHGRTAVALDRYGHWLVVLKILSFTGNSAEPDSRTYSEREAEAALEAIADASKALGSALQSLRNRVKPA